MIRGDAGRIAAPRFSPVWSAGLAMKVPPREKVEAPPSGTFRTRLAIGFGVAALVAALAGAFTWSRASAREQAEAVVRALDAGDVQAASAALSRLEARRPGSAEVEYFKARLAWRREDGAAVLDHLRKARDLGYPESPLNRLVGLLYARSGQPEKAEPMLLQAWETSTGNDPEVADALCRIFFESFRVDPALAVIDRWESRAPDDVRPRIWRAEVHSRRGPGPEIQAKDYTDILVLDPKHLLSYLGRANALERLGRFDEAKADYDRYLEARPDDPEGLAPAAKLAASRDEPAEALALYDRLLAVAPENPAGLLGKATILLSRGDATGAIGLLDVAVARSPADPEVHYRRGLALERLRRGDEAKDEFAERQRLQKELEEIERIRKALLREPENGQLRADAASWFFAHGYSEQGLEWAGKTLEIRPGNPSTLALLADHYEKAGNAALARFYRSQIPPGAPAP